MLSDKKVCEVVHHPLPLWPSQLILFHFQLSVDLTPGAATGKDVLKHISDFERSHQVTINEMYAQVSDTTLRALRRTLPVTKQKMDWNK